MAASQITRLELLEGRAIACTSSGSVHVIDLTHHAAATTTAAAATGGAPAGTRTHGSGSIVVVEGGRGPGGGAAAAGGAATVDHLDAVTGLGVSVYLQHFVTGSKDSHIKVRLAA